MGHLLAGSRPVLGFVKKMLIFFLTLKISGVECVPIIEIGLR